jgi:uncharacterized protein YndB with AHSA1/START domain
MTDEREQRTTEVAVETYIDAAPDVVFDYVTDPARFPGVEGGFRLGEPLEADSPRRASWWAGDGMVEVTLTPDGGGTQVRVVHRMDMPRMVSPRGRALALAA